METKVSVYPGVEGLKIIKAGKEKGIEKVPVSRSNGDKRIRECCDSEFFTKGCWETVNHVLRVNHALGGIISSDRDNARGILF